MYKHIFHFFSSEVFPSKQLSQRAIWLLISTEICWQKNLLIGTINTFLFFCFLHVLYTYFSLFSLPHSCIPFFVTNFCNYTFFLPPQFPAPHHRPLSRLTARWSVRRTPPAPSNQSDGQYTKSSPPSAGTHHGWLCFSRILTAGFVDPVFHLVFSFRSV